MFKKAILAGLSLMFLLALNSTHGADASAGWVTVDMACSAGGGVDVQVAWLGGSPAATQQWMDVSLQNNNWRQGTFAGLGPIAPTAGSIVASQLMPNAIYFVRVNQLLPNSYWDSSPTFSFRTPGDCPRTLAKPTLIVTSTTTGGNNGGGNGNVTKTPPSSSSTSGSTSKSAGDNCQPDYYGACLKPDSLGYSCEGSGGPGPDFIKGPVYLTGKNDPFELDRDGDGIGCNEPN